MLVNVCYNTEKEGGVFMSDVFAAIISIVIILALLALFIWIPIRITIWIIKKAIKEALREYEAEKQYGSQ